MGIILGQNLVSGWVSFNFPSGTSLPKKVLSYTPGVLCYMIVLNVLFFWTIPPSDIDECVDGNNTCDTNAICTNTDGSYYCICDDGYRGDGHDCDDINECAEGHSCHENAECVNNVGSYMCVCNDGYEGDGSNCEGKVYCNKFASSKSDHIIV